MLLMSTIFYYAMYARHDVIIESECLWLELNIANLAHFNLHHTANYHSDWTRAAGHFGGRTVKRIGTCADRRH